MKEKWIFFNLFSINLPLKAGGKVKAKVTILRNLFGEVLRGQIKEIYGQNYIQDCKTNQGSDFPQYIGKPIEMNAGGSFRYNVD